MKKLFVLFFLMFGADQLFAKQKCLKYGVIPYVNIPDIEKSYGDWKVYLESKMDRCINISFSPSYGDIINKFAHKELDFAFVGPFSYVLTKEVADVEPIVSGITSDGKATYRSLLSTTPDLAKELGIEKPLIGDKGMVLLKSKLDSYKKKWMIAFTDESSTSGYAVPNYYMKKNSLDPSKYFKKLTFVGTHDAAQLVVANNIIPFAFSAQMVYTRLLQNGKITKETNKIIWESEDIPKSPIIIRKDISKGLKNDLQNALVSIPKNYFPKIAKEIGYIKADENTYKIIEDINSYLKKEK